MIFKFGFDIQILIILIQNEYHNYFLVSYFKGMLWEIIKNSLIFQFDHFYNLFKMCNRKKYLLYFIIVLNHCISMEGALIPVKS